MGPAAVPVKSSGPHNDAGPRVSLRSAGVIVRVLVVEKDNAAAEGLTNSLRRHGYHAISVQTGNAALKTHHRADLVLLDVELSDIDGLEICREIRAACDTPIIVVTARGTELDR